MSKRTRSKGTTQHPSDSPAAEEVISQVKENLARQGRTLDDLIRETGQLVFCSCSYHGLWRLRQGDKGENYVVLQM